MGTRSLTIFNDTYNDEEIAVFYRQFDGYPEGHGKELLDLLKDMRVVNGMNSENMKFKIANGMDCLAAQVVAHFKNGPGDFYLYKAGTRDVLEEFIYTLYHKHGDLFIKVEDTYDGGNDLFDGNLEEYESWIKKR